MNRIAKTLILTLILLMLVFSLYPLGKSIDQTAPKNTNPIPELFYFPKTSFIKNIAFGYNNLLADMFWIRSIQYIGQHLISDNAYPYLYHILGLSMRITLALSFSQYMQMKKKKVLSLLKKA
jgi:hypothetical protein